MYFAIHLNEFARDKHGRRMTQVLVMDALNFSYEKEQFDQKLILRELNKVC